MDKLFDSMPENKEVGSYTFTITRDCTKWVYGHPDIREMVIADSLGELIWRVLKKKLRFKV